MINKFRIFLIFTLIIGILTPIVSTSAWADTGGMKASDYYKKHREEVEAFMTGQKDLGEGKEQIAGTQDLENAKKEFKNESGFWTSTWNGLKVVGAFISQVGNAITNDKEQVYTYTDPFTNQQVKYMRTEWGDIVAAEGNTRDCLPLPMAVLDASDCTFCSLFAVLYDASQDMTDLSFDRLAEPMANVILIGWAIFIALKVLAHVSSFTKQDAPKFINDILLISFKIGICYILLMNKEQIYDYFILPILGAGLEFGTAILTTGGNQCSGTFDVGNDTYILKTALFAKLNCFIESIQMEIGVSQAIGSTLMCVARNAATSDFGGFWNFNLLFQGLIIWAFALMLSLAFAFYLIDVTVSIGIIGALMPFLIVSWPFKITNKFSSAGLSMFMACVFTYAFMGIVVSVNTQLIAQSFNQGSSTLSGSINPYTAKMNQQEKEVIVPGTSPVPPEEEKSKVTETIQQGGNAFNLGQQHNWGQPSIEDIKKGQTGTNGSNGTSGGSSGGTSGGSSGEGGSSGTTGDSSSTSGTEAGGMAGLIAALSSDNIDELERMTDIGMGGFLIMLCCSIFGFKLCSKVSEIASKVSGGSVGFSIGAGIGGMAANAITSTAKSVTKAPRQFIGQKFDQGMSKLGNAALSKLGLGKYGGKTGAGKGGTPAAAANKGGAPAAAANKGGAPANANSTANANAGNNQGGEGSSQGSQSETQSTANTHNTPTKGANLKKNLESERQQKHKKAKNKRKSHRKAGNKKH